MAERTDTSSPGLSEVPVILASTSKARAALLRQAGLRFSVEAPSIDEAAVRDSLRAEGASGVEVAAALAELKAVRVGSNNKESLVIGADQILDCDGVWFDKPTDMDHARAQLLALRGRSHELCTAVCVVQGETRLWHHVERSRLVMRAFSEGFLDEYLGVVGNSALEAVGAYRLEGLGVQLFERVDADYFSVLGLPLLSLLAFLRGRGVVRR